MDKHDNNVKRKLTLEEIDNIIDFLTIKNNTIKTLPYESQKSVSDHIKNMLKKQLLKQEIYPKMIPELKRRIEKEYHRTIIQPGESVGILCAQSIGQQQTQTTLNTFHKAGLSETLVVSGISRFSELLGVTKNPKMVGNRVYFEKNNKSIKDLRKMIGNEILYVDFKRLIVNYNVKKLNKNSTMEYWYEIYKMLYNKDYLEDDYVITFNLNKKILFNNSITLEIIADKITQEFEDITCFFSPLELATINIHINEKYFPFPTDIENISFIINEKTITSFIWKEVIPKLEKIYISGISGIEDIFYLQENNEWIIETHGSNYSTFLSLPYVNSIKTMSNFVWDIYENLGIEAVREYIINSFIDIMPSVNKCHIQLLVDIITQSGIPKPISRHSMMIEQTGPLSKASFEETLDNFLKAGLYGECENTNGISSSIICGKLGRIGTGIIDIKINPNILENNLLTPS